MISPDTNPDATNAAFVMESAPGPLTRIGGREVLYFAGTGYLGLQSHPEVIAAAQAAAALYGVHTATTRSGFGNSPPVLEVERRTAELLAAPAACYLVSGYVVNFAIAAAIRAQVDIALIDESAHDCLGEATRWLDLARPLIPFRHRDSEHLAALLSAELKPGERPLVLTDGVFAASGRLAPLGEYLSLLAEIPGAQLLVDDAHAVGVLGASGRGSLEHAGLAADDINTHEHAGRAVRVCQSLTLSKALGGHGGAVAGTPQFLEQVRSSSGLFRGASAPAAPVAAATAKALQLVQQNPELRRQLAANVHHARTALRGLGLGVEDSPSAIISITLESAATMQRVQAALFDAGIAIAHTRGYAGSGPDGMLRIAVFATHTPEMIDRLAVSLGRVL